MSPPLPLSVPISGFTTALAALGFMAFLASLAAAWLWGPATLAAWRRRRVAQEPFPAEWRDILRRRRRAGRKRLLPKGVEIHFKRHTQQHA